MGVDGCWCAPRSSKPVRGVKSLSGEFDSHMLPPEPRGRVPRGFLKNVDFPLDRTEGSSYNTTVRGVSRTTSYPGVAQLVARMVRDHEAASSSLATPTTSPRTSYRSRRLFGKSHFSLILSRLLSESNPLRCASIRFFITAPDIFFVNATQVKSYILVLRVRLKCSFFYIKPPCYTAGQ